MKIFCLLVVAVIFGGCGSDIDNPEDVIHEIELLKGFVIKNDAGEVIYINLSSCNIDESLIHKLPVFGHLQYLHLENTSLDNKGLESLGKIKTLEVLDINMTDTTDEGLFFLLELDHLKELRMSHYSLTRPIPEELRGVDVEDVLSGKVKIKTEQRYGEGVRVLMAKFPGLKTELWGGLPDSQH